MDPDEYEQEEPQYAPPPSPAPVDVASILDGLTPEQAAAVTHADGPLIVVAGPGSGKTRVIARRVAYLVLARGVRPWNILAITFTNKAADEMKRRVEALLGAGSGAHVSTFHSFCARTLRHYGAPGREPGFTIYDDDDQRACVKKALTELSLDEAHWKPGEMLSRISDAKSKLIGPTEFEEGAHDFLDRTVSRVYAKYEETLQQFNALDFDDLLLYTVRLLETNESARDALRARYKYVLVDEYQDTNRPQYMIANLLVGENGNLCVVGDPDQSIYKWRGADIGNILHFERDHPGALEIRLERNYRSSGRIVEAAQGLIAHNSERREKTIFTDNEAGDRLRVVHCQLDEDEARFISDEIAKRFRSGDVKAAEIALFYRTNALSKAFERELLRRGVPHVIIGAVPFFQRKEVKDVLAFLRLLGNPRDEVQLRRAASILEGLGASTVKRLEAFATKRGCTLLEAAKHVDDNHEVKARERKAVARLTAVLEGLQALSEGGAVGPMIKEIAESTGLKTRLLQSKDPQDHARADNVEALVNDAYEFDERPPAAGPGGYAGSAPPELGEERRVGWQGFLDHVSLLTSQDDEKDDGTKVRLMTLHAAKGLEFDEVFIAGADARLLPLTRDDEPVDLEEERRLFYVGITRARKRVTITTTRLRRTWGQEREASASPFLREIPGGCVDSRGSLGFDLDIESAGPLTDFVSRGAQQRTRSRDRFDGRDEDPDDDARSTFRGRTTRVQSEDADEDDFDEDDEDRSPSRKKSSTADDERDPWDDDLELRKKAASKPVLKPVEGLVASRPIPPAKPPPRPAEPPRPSISTAPIARDSAPPAPPKPPAPAAPKPIAPRAAAKPPEPDSAIAYAMPLFAGIKMPAPLGKTTATPSARTGAGKSTELVAGDRVQHAVFGSGQVVALTGEGPGRRVEVEFDMAGKKSLVLQYANLQRA